MIGKNGELSIEKVTNEVNYIFSIGKSSGGACWVVDAIWSVIGTCICLKVVVISIVR